MKAFLFLAIFLLGLSRCQTPTPLPTPLTELAPTVLAHEGAALFQHWEMPDHPALWEEHLGAVPALQAYRDSLALVLGADSLATVLAAERSQDHPLPSPPDTMDNYWLTHTGQLGKIRALHWLEAEILNYQLTRYPLLGHPTEFHGFIARHDSLQRVRVYFAASDAPWPPKPGPIIPHLENAMTEGWQLPYHLHNHYNDPEGSYVGAMGPSQADAQYFKALRERFQLQEALITNGFTTVVLVADELDGFFSH